MYNIDKLWEAVVMRAAMDYAEYVRFTNRDYTGVELHPNTRSRHHQIIKNGREARNFLENLSNTEFYSDEYGKYIIKMIDKDGGMINCVTSVGRLKCDTTERKMV